MEDTLANTPAGDKVRFVLWDAARTELKRVADLSPLMVWITEPDGYCIYLNSRWYDFTGQAPGGGEGTGWVQAVHGDDRQLAIAAFSYATSNGLPYHTEYRLCRRDAEYEWVSAVGHPFFTSDGQLSGYIGSDASAEGLSRQRAALDGVLTPREREVVEWVAAGKTSSEIGVILDISTRTVETHVQSAMVKLGATNRVQMTVEAMRRNEISIYPG